MFYQLHCHEIVFFWNCTWNQIFRKKSHFEEKAPKYPQMKYFGFYQKFIALIFFCFDAVWSFYYSAKTAFLRIIFWLFPQNESFSKKSGSMCNILWFAIYCPIHSQPTRLFDSFPAGIYLLKVNNRNTRTRCEICSKLTIKIPERRLWYR